MVRDVVDDRGHAPLIQRVEQRRQTLEPTQLLPNARVVDDVVAVGAPGHRLGDRREVRVADPEPVQPVELAPRHVEATVRGELETVRGDPLDDGHGRRSARGIGK